MKRSTLASVIVAGLAIGFGGHALLRPPQDRVERIFELFTEICLPVFHSGVQAPPKRLGLTPAPSVDSAQTWIDGQSTSFLSIGGRSCSIVTDVPYVLSRREGNLLTKALAALVKAEFPDLTLDPAATLGPKVISKAWTAGARHTEERWGIAHYVFLYGTDDDISLLSIAPPRGK